MRPRLTSRFLRRPTAVQPWRSLRRALTFGVSCALVGVGCTPELGNNVSLTFLSEWRECEATQCGFRFGYVYRGRSLRCATQSAFGIFSVYGPTGRGRMAGGE